MFPNDDVIRSAMLDALAHTATGVLSVKCCVGLIAKPFTPSTDGELPADPFPTFTGYAIKERAAVDAQIIIDPVTGRIAVRLPAPVGGWTFTCTADPAEPETIYGVYVTMGVEDSEDQTPVTGCEVFPTPIVISNASQQIVVSDITFELLAPYMV